MSQKMILPVVRLSYPNLFEARGYQGSKPKFSAALVFAPGADLKALKTLVLSVATEKWGDKAKSVIKAMRDAPIRDGEAKGYGKGSLFINAKSIRQPGVVGRTAGPDGKPIMIDEDMATAPEGPYEMYPGVQVKAYISIYASEGGGNKGVYFGLEGLQRWDEDERLDGRTSVSEVFDIEDAQDVDLSDVMAEDDEQAEGIDEIL